MTDRIARSLALTGIVIAVLAVVISFLNIVREQPAVWQPPQPETSPPARDEGPIADRESAAVNPKAEPALDPPWNPALEAMEKAQKTRFQEIEDRLERHQQALKISQKTLLVTINDETPEVVLKVPRDGRLHWYRWKTVALDPAIEEVLEVQVKSEGAWKIVQGGWRIENHSILFSISSHYGPGDPPPQFYEETSGTVQYKIIAR